MRIKNIRWNVFSLSLMGILISLACSFLSPSVLSQSSASGSIQSQGEILYSTPPALKPQLRVNGLYLEDGLGNRIRLKGIQVDWNERVKRYGTDSVSSSPEESWFTIEDVRRMKEMGANFAEMVVIGIPEAMPTRNVIKESYFTIWVDKWVVWATQYQLYVQVDMRGFGAWAQYAINLSVPRWLWEGLYPQPTTKAEYDAIIRDFFDLNVTKQDINRKACSNLWKFIANRYKSNPYVLFSIMNEPFYGVEIPNEATAIHLGQTYSTYMASVVDAIRSTGAQQLVFINHPFLWDSQGMTTVKPVDRDNIVWEGHNYVTPTRNFSYWKSQINNLAEKYVDEFRKPLFIGEYGLNPLKTCIRTTYQTTWKTMLSDQVAYLDSLSLVGRQWHQWGFMDGEYYDYTGLSDLTLDESNYILQTVLG